MQLITYGLPEVVTDQAVFEKVAAHLLQQGVRAMRPTPTGHSCSYRGVRETACAVGCLISDDRYDPGMEGKIADVSFVSEYLPELIGSQHLLRSLQYIHDDGDSWDGRGSSRDTLRKRLMRVAENYGLTIPAFLEDGAAVPA